MALPVRQEGSGTYLVEVSFYDAPYVKNIDAYLKKFIKKTVVVCHLAVESEMDCVSFYNSLIGKWILVPFTHIEEIETDLGTEHEDHLYH